MRVANQHRTREPIYTTTKPPTKIKWLSVRRFFYSPLINFTSSISLGPLSRKIWFVFGLIIFACKIQSLSFAFLHLTFCLFPVFGLCLCVSSRYFFSVWWCKEIWQRERVSSPIWQTNNTLSNTLPAYLCWLNGKQNTWIWKFSNKLNSTPFEGQYKR